MKYTATCSVDTDFEDTDYQEGDFSMSNEGGQSGERQLWCAVIHQAVIDYRCILPKMALEHRQAKIWFRNNGNDFQTVCELAAMNPHKIREKVLKIGKGKHYETEFKL